MKNGFSLAGLGLIGESALIEHRGFWRGKKWKETTFIRTEEHHGTASTAGPGEPGTSPADDQRVALRNLRRRNGC